MSMTFDTKIAIVLRDDLEMWQELNVIAFIANAQEMQKAFQRAFDQNVRLAIFTKDLFSTQNDIDNRAAVADKTVDNLDLVGLAMRDSKKTVDKVIKGLKFHK